MGNSSVVTDKMFDAVRKEFGDEAIYYAKDIPPVGVVNSGSLSLDFAIGIGGMPTNRAVELSGAEGSGKTTLALLIAAQVLAAKPDKGVVFFDLEHKLTPSWLQTLIGEDNMDRFLIVAPDSIEQTSEIYRRIVTTGKVAMAIIDSIGGAPTNQAMDDTRNLAQKADSMGGNAKGVTAFARLAANFSAKYEVLTIGINQTRDDTKSMHGNMLSTPGGRGWKHACVLRLEIRQGKEKYYVKENGEDRLVGFDVRAKVHKNQLGGDEGRTAEWRFFARPSETFGPIGIDTVEECVRLANLTGVVVRAGAYYRHEVFPGGQVQGQPAVSKLVSEDPKVRERIVADVMAVLRKDPSKIADVSPIEPVYDDE